LCKSRELVFQTENVFKPPMTQLEQLQDLAILNLFAKKIKNCPKNWIQQTLQTLPSLSPIAVERGRRMLRRSEGAGCRGRAQVSPSGEGEERVRVSFFCHGRVWSWRCGRRESSGGLGGGGLEPPTTGATMRAPPKPP
jgi:hypothetical protein